MKTAFVLMIGVLAGAGAMWLSVRRPAAASASTTIVRGEDPSVVIAAAQGRVEGRTDSVEVGASVNGVIRSLRVKEGDRVSKGQIIAQLACDDLDAQVRGMQAVLESARETRARLLRGSREEERQVAEQQVAAAQALVDQARRQNDRMQLLVSKDEVSQQTADAAKRDLASAEAALKTAVAKQKLVNAGPLPEEVLKDDADVAAAQERLLAAAAQRDKCVIHAPISGTIIRVNLRAGEAFSAVMPRSIVTMADVSANRIRAEVDERDLARVRINQRVRISADGFGDFSGKVVRTSLAMGRKTARSTDPTEKSDRDILETFIAPDPGAPRLPIGLRVVVTFLQ